VIEHKGKTILEYIAGKYDIAVIGAGHAGIEAALAAARLGLRVACFAINLDSVGNMPCNPAIGGTSKGTIVREIDALGGEMAKAADAACIQYRMLNRGKGPAVQCLRAQADRRKYQEYMKHALESCPGLDLKQAEITELRAENGAVISVITSAGAVYEIKAAVMCTGTYLRGRVIMGDYARDSGPDGMFPSVALYDSLVALGLAMRRFKSGTPARINRRSVDFDKMQLQKGDDDIIPFSFDSAGPPRNTAVCHLTYTTEVTHEVIRRNIGRSPLYSGAITGVGPRYCPSIEDKVMRFADKDRHQVFVEPMGENTGEMYLQGLSSSLPEEVQIELMRTVPGLENVSVQRPAYAIEYDCVDPLDLRPSLECKAVSGLFGAGQFNGTSGYEEAAAQGIVAGINAARYVQGKPPVIIGRDAAYIGVLIDDLVTKGTEEPYRMMSARAEYRLILRGDNADLRLMPIGLEAGLVSQERYDKMRVKYEAVEKEIARLEKTGAKGNLPGIAAEGAKLAALLRRPGVTYERLATLDPERPSLAREITEQVGIKIKYDGYIKREQLRMDKFRKMEQRLIPKDIDYMSINAISMEGRHKLDKIRPESLGQAARISGVSPADIAALMFYV